jgi:predicted amidophosphoribosyltransferase
MVIADRGDGVFTHGTTCAYCLWRFSRDPDEAVTVCPSCATPYHTDCFDENGGCATFGCANWVTTQAAAGVPGVAVPPPQQQLQPPPASVTAPAPVPVVPVGQQPALASARWNFCSQCGASVDANYEFCIQCGQRIGTQA